MDRCDNPSNFVVTLVHKRLERKEATKTWENDFIEVRLLLRRR